MQRLCIDCDYFRVSVHDDVAEKEDLHKCAFNPSPINGKASDYCTIERKYDWKCGIDGRHWKEKTIQEIEPEDEGESLSFWEKILGKRKGD